MYSQVQRPNTGGKYSKTKQIEQGDNNTEKGSGSNRSSRMIKQIQAANNQADNLLLNKSNDALDVSIGSNGTTKKRSGGQPSQS